MNMTDELSALRRSFHRYPETAWTEIWTSCQIAEYLTALGYEVLTGREVCDESSRMGLPDKAALEEAYQRAVRLGADPDLAEGMRGGFTGVIGILRCEAGPVTALRFDIDALPIQESTALSHRPFAEGFRSELEGCSHACGHDGHITIGLGTAQALMERKSELHGTIKLLFQPAEEGVRGARSIAEKGHLDGVDYLLAAHMGGGVDTPPGTILIKSGKTLATTKLDAVFHGRSAHAGEAPHEGQNAMLSAASAVLNLHAIPRHGTAGTQVNVGTIQGGSGRNVVCDRVKLELEVRGSTTEANEYMTGYALRVLRSSAELHGCTVDIQQMGSASCAENDRSLSEHLAVLWREKGLTVEERYEDIWTVSEDFSCLAQRVQSQGGQAGYFHVLSTCPAGLHQRNFDFDESALSAGVEAFTSAVLDLSEFIKKYTGE